MKAIKSGRGDTRGEGWGFGGGRSRRKMIKFTRFWGRFIKHTTKFAFGWRKPFLFKDEKKKEKGNHPWLGDVRSREFFIEKF